MTRYLLFVFCLSLSALSQSVDAEPPAKRDASAVALLKSALNALGADASIRNLPVCRAEGRGSYGDKSGTFKWLNDGASFRYVNEIDGQRQTYVSGRGQPAFNSSGKTRKLPPHASMADLPSHLTPFLLGMYLGTPEYQIKMLEPIVIAGSQVARVEVAYGQSDLRSTFKQVWSIDEKTGIPIMVDYALPAHINASQLIPFRDQFSDFNTVQGVLFPMHIDRFMNGQPVNSFLIEKLHCGGSSSADEFEIGGEQ
jgi:hypothetical protein